MDKKLIAANLAAELRDLADLVVLAGNGDAEAKAKVASHVDNYWCALVVGNSRETSVTAILEDD